METGTGCSMVRSINIGKTGELVWGMIKSVLQQIQDRSPVGCVATRFEYHDRSDRDGLLTDGITWMSPNQIDLLSDDEKKVVVGNLITRITASFNPETKKHRLDVEFAETVSQMLDHSSDGQRTLAESGDLVGEPSEALGEDREAGLRNNAGKKSGGSRINSAAERNYSVTAE